VTFSTLSHEKMTDPTKDFLSFLLLLFVVSFFLQSHETITALHPEEKP
jgi:hypothetical protein